jgi:hypothetical protein
MDIKTLPRHARTGVLAVGWRKARTGETGPQPIWPIRGGDGSEDDDPDDDQDPAGNDPQDDPDDDQDPDGADQLGDAGKKALDAQKARWKQERDRRKQLEQELAAERAKKATDDQPTPEQIREQARAEARAEALRERALDRLEAKAARLLADPEDARRFLGSQIEDFIDGDKVDNAAITEAIEELIKNKPYLAAATAPRFQGTGDGGARKGSAPTQLTRADLKKMTAEQIDKAREEGRLDNLMSGK